MIYYISNQGSDANDGQTPERAWASIQKVNATIRRGDTIRFRRGDTFYGQIKLPEGGTGKTVYEAYGEGARPVISQYKLVTGTDSWEQTTPNIWRINLTDQKGYTGNLTSPDANVGFIKADGVIYGRKLFLLEQLHYQWDFYSDDTFLYVYSPENPSCIATDIRIACNICSIVLSDGMQISGLDIVGSGGHGIRGSASDVTISDCELHELGGSWLADHWYQTTRYGNGIEIWSDSENITITGNRLYDIYDVAFTMQGDRVTKGWKNILCSDNIIYHCEQSFEIWSKGGYANTGFFNCYFENNVCLFSGYGWSHKVRPDRRGVHLLVYVIECPENDITIRNNVFYHVKDALYYVGSFSDNLPKGYRSGQNFISMKKTNQSLTVCSTSLPASTKHFRHTFRKKRIPYF
ncbi:MAG: hypothetical protein E7397_07945 [Ruminococcaceae bacterium]|nr:hypothetical protein [Oscillospiraceae bacterium]